MELNLYPDTEPDHATTYRDIGTQYDYATEISCIAATPSNADPALKWGRDEVTTDEQPPPQRHSRRADRQTMAQNPKVEKSPAIQLITKPTLTRPQSCSQHR